MNEKMIENIIKKAHQIASTVMFVNPSVVAPIINAGWDAVPSGSLVYRDGVVRGNKTYIKVDNNTVKNQDDVEMPMNDQQKKNMLGMYALLQALKQN